MHWDDLSAEEWTALPRMSRGLYSQLARELGDRLVELGLAQQTPAGIGIGRAGHEMVIESLLRTRDS